MPDLTRRSFLTGSVGLAAGASAAAGMLGQVSGVLGTPELRSAGDVADTAHRTAETDAASAVVDGTTVYVRDAASGELVIMSGESETVVHDVHLVAALGHASNRSEV